MIRCLLLAGWFMICCSQLTGQLPEPVFLNNPSFEGEAADATIPVGWFVSTPGTTPDILPGYWGVYQEPSDGDTYVGLITRPDGSWEAMAQRLPRRLKANECYRMAIDLAHSKTYSGYNGPLRLRIYGGSKRTDRRYMLYESPVIKHTYWKTYLINFTLEKNIDYIILEAFHSDQPFDYPGNILLDNISPLESCPRA